MSEWEERAACSGSACPEIWFSYTRSEVEAAQAICEGCPVRRDCGEAAVKRDERFGIRAGFDLEDVRQRRALARWLEGVQVLGRATKICAECGGWFETKHANATRCRPCTHGLVDSGPVVEHLKRLHEFMTYPEISDQVLVAPQTLGSIAKGRYPHIKRANAERILAIPLRTGVRS
ncbi:WhiB family transcriptional regulator [Nocardia sp. CC227C]|uniref:WhiB family transcriptional regulator n=1 Tax=Nocardia sp. CC227C TaxID=3044562 RepID=UPI00278BE6BD|nr:WhiB family transcriptional regulator [Nocardia sp. CC227C]